MKKQNLLNIGETQVVLRKNDLLGNEKKLALQLKLSQNLMKLYFLLFDLRGQDP